MGGVRITAQMQIDMICEGLLSSIIGQYRQYVPFIQENSGVRSPHFTNNCLLVYIPFGTTGLLSERKRDMARPLGITSPGAFYHITSRGNERKPIFKSKQDKIFYEYLESATDRHSAVVHAFCLMDNHYHLLLETPSGNLPQIMRHINGAYTTYFNVKRARSGHLFQGCEKAILVEKAA
jgi:REP element-mobilizing transposase RayT